MNHIIGIDLDGVLANFVGSHSARLMEISGKNLFPPDWKDDPPVWDYDKHFGYLDTECKAVWQEIKQSNKFWRNLKPLPAMEKFVYALNNSPLGLTTIYYITDRPGKDVKVQSEDWLEMHGVKKPQVLVSSRKGELAVGLKLTSFIDDKPSNIHAVEFYSPDTHSYLLASSWNTAERNTVTRVCTSVEEFLKREGF